MAGPFGGYAEDEAPPPEKKKFGWGDTWPARMAKDLIEAAKLPGDVAAGRVDPLSDEAIGRSVDLAGAVSGGMGKQLGVPARQIKQTGMGKWFGAPKEGPMPSGRAPGLLREEGITMPREGATPEIGTPAGEAHMVEYGQQAAEQTRAAVNEITRSFDPQGVSRSPEQAGAAVTDAMQRAAEVKNRSIREAFKPAISPDEGGKMGAINAAAFTVVPQNIVMDLDRAGIMLGGKDTQYAEDMLKHITRDVAQLSTGNQGGPAAGAYGNVNLAAIDKLKLSLNTYRRAAFSTRNNDQIKTAQAVTESFNNHIDQIINSKAFVGDIKKVKAWNIAREHETMFSQRFESTGNRRSVGEVVQKIIGDSKHAPATPTQVGDHLWGGIGTLPDHYNVAVARRIRDILGADSQEWAGAKQHLWRNMIDIGKTDDWQPRMIKDRVLDFLDGSGKAVADTVYSGQQRAIMRDFAKTQGTLDLAMRATGMTGQTAAKVTGGMAAKVEGAIAKFADGVLQGVDRAIAYAMERQELNDLQQKFPIIRKATEEWFAEVQRAQRTNVGNPAQQRKGMFAATTAYALKLRKVGIGSVSTQMAKQGGGQDKLSADRAFGGPAM